MKQKNKKCILIVDDSPDQLFLLKMLLEAKGYTTQCTSNGEEALAFLRSGQKLPEAILLDLNMKVMNGFEFRELQRNDLSLKDIPIIVVSGEDRLASIQTQMNLDVLKKPFDIPKLLETIERNTRDLKQKS